MPAGVLDEQKRSDIYSFQIFGASYCILHGLSNPVLDVVPESRLRVGSTQLT